VSYADSTRPELIFHCNGSLCACSLHSLYQSLTQFSLHVLKYSMYYFLLPHAAVPVTATDLPEGTKTRQTDFTKKRSVISFRSIANSICLHQLSSIRHGFNVISCSRNSIIQEDNSKLTSQIFCNSFFIYDCCAKTFGCAVLCRGQDSFCNSLLTPSSVAHTICERSSLSSRKYA